VLSYGEDLGNAGCSVNVCDDAPFPSLINFADRRQVFRGMCHVYTVSWQYFIYFPH